MCVCVGGGGGVVCFVFCLFLFVFCVFCFAGLLFILFVCLFLTDLNAMYTKHSCTRVRWNLTGQSFMLILSETPPRNGRCKMESNWPVIYANFE